MAASGESPLPATATPSLARDAISGVAARLLLIAVTFANSIVVARWLGPEQRGVYALVLLVNSLGASMVELGIGYAGMAFVARRELTLADMQGVAVVLSIAGGAVCAGAWIVLGDALRAGPLTGLPAAHAWLALAVVPCTLYSSYWTGAMIGAGRVIAMNAVSVLTIAAKAFADMTLLVLGFGLQGVLTSWTAYQIGSTLLMLYLLNPTRGRPRFRWPACVALLRYGLVLYAGRFASIVQLRFGMLLLNHHRGPEAVGVYTVASDLAERIAIVPEAVKNAAASRVGAASPPEAVALTARATRHVALTLGLLVAGLAGAGFVAIPWLYGAEYRDSARLFAVLSAGAVLVGIAIQTNPLIAVNQNRPGLLTALAWVNAALNAALALLLVPRLGALGSAIAYSATVLFGCAALLQVVRHVGRTSLRDLLVIRRADLQDYHRLLARARLRLRRRGAGT